MGPGVCYPHLPMLLCPMHLPLTWGQGCAGFLGPWLSDSRLAAQRKALVVLWCWWELNKFGLLEGS